jgi:hypothetical protein
MTINHEQNSVIKQQSETKAIHTREHRHCYLDEKASISICSRARFDS